MTMRATLRRESQAKERSRRIVFAAGVLILHVVVLQAVISMRRTFDAPKEERSLIWVPLAPRDPEIVRPAPTAPIFKPSDLQLPAIPRVETNAITLPPIVAPAPDPGFAALSRYLACGLPDMSKAPIELQERCAKLRQSLNNAPLTPRPPTEQERKRARELEHELAVQNAPVMLPCGGLRNIACMINGALTGEFKMDSYADHRATAQRGNPPGAARPPLSSH